MKTFRMILLPAFLLLVMSVPCHAAKFSDWDDFMNYAHRYTFLTKDRLSSELDEQEKACGTTLKEYNQTALARISGTSNDRSPVEVTMSRISQTLNADFYMKAAIGEYIYFLKTNDANCLNNALKIISHLSPSFKINKRYSFWNYLIKASFHLVNKDSAMFKKSMFDLWSQVIIPLKREHSNGLDSPGTFSADLESICANALHLITYKAIIEYRNSDMFSTGVLAVDLSRVFNDEDNFYRGMMNFFDGRESDSSNLNFTVPLVYGLIAADSLDSATTPQKYEEAFKNALRLFNFAENCAATDKGRATVLMKKTVVIAKALAGKFNGSTLTETPYFEKKLSKLSQDTLDNYETLYARLARPADKRSDVKIKNGFAANPGDYTKTMRELWTSYITLMDWRTTVLQASGDFSDKVRAKKNYSDQILFANRYMRDKKYADIIPASAFYAVAGCASRLAMYFVDQATITRLPQDVDQAIFFQAYATMLNPMDINSLIIFSSKIQLELEQGMRFVNLFKPLSDLLSSSIRSSQKNDIYMSHEKEIEYLASEVEPLYTSLPFIVEYVDGAQSSLCSKTIALSNIYYAVAMSPQKRRRFKQECSEITAGRSLTDTGAELTSRLSNDLSGMIPESSRNVPYDFYRLNLKMVTGSDPGLAEFLKNLYYNTEHEMKMVSNTNIREMDNHVINFCKAINKI